MKPARLSRWILAVSIACGGAPLASAAPIVPAHDDEVVEVLPGGIARGSGRDDDGARRRDREWRRGLAANPRDATLAVQAAREWLERAREQGDPRPAGRALAVLAPWDGDANAPVEVLVMRGLLQQHLHEFDAAAATLQAALARDPRHAQAWLALATVRRVQARYTESDEACARLHALGAGVHGAACAAENAALRGRVDTARAALQRLVVQARGDAAARAWLMTTLAELEWRAGRPLDAERAYREALAASPDPYAALGLADLLIEQGRAEDAKRALQGLARSDAVLLRLAIAGDEASVAEWRERQRQAAARPGSAGAHARELALFALHVDRDARRSLALARENLRAQREPPDLLLFARAARAAGDSGALNELRALLKETGLHDRRVEALL